MPLVTPLLHTPSFNSLNEKEKFKFVLSCTDSGLSKICIQGVYKAKTNTASANAVYFANTGPGCSKHR